jgi:predicted nucleic acid-binding protein
LAAFTALYDASVLYPAPLRDLLIHLAGTDVFRARWTERIHEEWLTSLLRNRPDLSRERLERTRNLIDAAVLDCLVEGYESLIPGVILPDPNDRHVLAAAIHARAEVIVTVNLKDFPRAVLSQFKIEAQQPDDFVLRLIDLAPASVRRAVRLHRTSLRSPLKTVEEYLDTLLRQNLPRTAAALREFSTLL